MIISKHNTFLHIERDSLFFMITEKSNSYLVFNVKKNIFENDKFLMNFRVNKKFICYQLCIKNEKILLI